MVESLGTSRVRRALLPLRPRFWPEVHRISGQHGAPYLSWKYLYFTSERRPRLGPWLYRLRFLRDRLSRGSP